MGDAYLKQKNNSGSGEKEDCVKTIQKTYEDLEPLQTLWIKHFQFWITNKNMVPSNKKLLRKWGGLEANF